MGRVTASGETGQHQTAEERIADCVASSAKTILLWYISSFRARALRGMCRLCLHKAMNVEIVDYHQVNRMSIQREELNTLKFGNIASGEKLPPAHPGEILLQDFIEPMELIRYKVAKFTNIPQRRIDDICSGSRASTADTAMRLDRLFGMLAQTWMNLQAQYDLEVAVTEQGDKMDREVLPIAA